MDILRLATLVINLLSYFVLAARRYGSWGGNDFDDEAAGEGFEVREDEFSFRGNVR